MVAGVSTYQRNSAAWGLGERGASILIALFFFLICALVGGVVLTAATVSTGQLVGYEKSQQAYYSVTSAAQLFRDELVGGTYTLENDEIKCVLTDKSTSMQDFIARQVTQAKDGTALPVELKVSAPNDNLLGTTATFSMAKASATGDHAPYDITVTFRPTDYQEKVGAYQVTLTVPASCLYSEDGTVLKAITWEQAIISKPIRATAGS